MARSRHIILAERSASASPFGVCTGPYRFRAVTSCTIRSLARVRNDVTAVGIALSNRSLGAVSCLSRIQRIPSSRYAPRTCTCLLVVALLECWWCTALTRDDLHQLHGLPTGRTTKHTWRSGHPGRGRNRHGRGFCLLWRHQQRPYLLQRVAIPHPQQPVIADLDKAVR